MRFRVAVAALITMFTVCAIPFSSSASSDQSGPSSRHIIYHLHSGSTKIGSGRLKLWTRMTRDGHGVAGARVVFHLRGQAGRAAGTTSKNGRAALILRASHAQGWAGLRFRGRTYRVRLGASASVNGDPSVTVTQSIVAGPGSEIQVQGSGFTPYEVIHVYLDTLSTLLGEVTADNLIYGVPPPGQWWSVTGCHRGARWSVFAGGSILLP